MSPLRNFIDELRGRGIDVPEELAVEYKLKEKEAIKSAILWGGDYSKRWQDVAEQYYNEEYSEL